MQRQRRRLEAAFGPAVPPQPEVHLPAPPGQPLQAKGLELGRLNVAGEDHPESDGRRQAEREYALDVLHLNGYYQEFEFELVAGTGRQADPPQLLVGHSVFRLLESYTLDHLGRQYAGEEVAGERIDRAQAIDRSRVLFDRITRELQEMRANVDKLRKEGEADRQSEDAPELEAHRSVELMHAELAALEKTFGVIAINFPSRAEEELTAEVTAAMGDFMSAAARMKAGFEQVELLDRRSIDQLRSIQMHQAAQERHRDSAVWKIGDDHVEDIGKLKGRERRYNLVTREEFNAELPSGAELASWR